MAFISRYCRVQLNCKQPTLFRMSVIRNDLLNCMDKFTTGILDNRADAEEFTILVNIFRAIIKNASPEPLRQPDGALVKWSTPPTASRKRQVDPPSFQDPPGYTATKRPRYSEGHDEASDDDAEAQLLFSPPTRPRPDSSVIDLSQPMYPTLLSPSKLNDVDEVK